jgi:hypothetical protein
MKVKVSGKGFDFTTVLPNYLKNEGEVRVSLVW